jgi:hypothetical protein
MKITKTLSNRITRAQQTACKWITFPILSLAIFASSCASDHYPGENLPQDKTSILLPFDNSQPATHDDPFRHTAFHWPYATVRELDGVSHRRMLLQQGPVQLTPGQHLMKFWIETQTGSSMYEQTIQFETKAGYHYEFRFRSVSHFPLNGIIARILETETGRTFDEPGATWPN